MTKEEFGKEFKRLTAYYHHQANKIEAEEYFTAVSRIPVADFSVLVGEAIKRCEYWPKASTILELKGEFFPPSQRHDVEAEQAAGRNEALVVAFLDLPPEDQAQYFASAEAVMLQDSNAAGLQYLKTDLPKTYARALTFLAATLWNRKEDSENGAEATAQIPGVR